MVPAADGFRRSSRPLVISFSRLILPAGLMMAMDPGLPSIIIEALGRCAVDHIPAADFMRPAGGLEGPLGCPFSGIGSVHPLIPLGAGGRPGGQETERNGTWDYSPGDIYPIGWSTVLLVHSCAG